MNLKCVADASSLGFLVAGARHIALEACGQFCMWQISDVNFCVCHRCS
jgi:hypothetical protein